MANAFLATLVLFTVLCQLKAGEAKESCKPLGMQNGDIPDANITASSTYGKNNSHSPYLARLLKVKEGIFKGGWVAKYNNQNQWLQVRFGDVKNVTRIATQGRQDYSQWVTSYSLNYSMNGNTFMSYNNGEILEGNRDRNSIVYHFLNETIRGRYIRVIPKTWKRRIALRMELYECTDSASLTATTTSPTIPASPTSTAGCSTQNQLPYPALLCLCVLYFWPSF